MRPIATSAGQGSAISRVSLLLACGLVQVGLSGCVGTVTPRPPAVYNDEAFSKQSAYSRDFSASAKATCEAARRALLSQGYVTKDSNPNQVNGTKRFQPKDATYTEIEFSVVCTPNNVAGEHAILFANAFQGYYILKKAPTTASVGLSALGSLSLPVGSTDEALVRIGGETIASEFFYERFFALTQHYLASVPDYQ
jgi:Uncharacterized protein conserved in bacteria (DUF2242)